MTAITLAAQERRWLPAISLLALMIGLPVGGLVATGALASIPQPPVVVEAGVEVTPPASWEFAERTGPDGEIVILTNGTASLAVVVDRASSSTAGALDAYVEAMRIEATHLSTGEVEPLEVVGQPAGLQVVYQAVVLGLGYPIEGEVSAIPLADGRVVIFDGWSVQGTYGASRGEIDTIIRSSRLGQ